MHQLEANYATTPIMRSLIEFKESKLYNEEKCGELYRRAWLACDDAIVAPKYDKEVYGCAIRKTGMDLVKCVHFEKKI